MKTILHFKEEDATTSGMPIGRVSFENPEALKGLAITLAERVEGKFIELSLARKIARRLNISLSIS